MVFSNIGVFAVEEPAPGVFKDCTTRNDGATFLQDNAGFILVLHIKTPNSREIFSCQKHTIESAYYAEGPFGLGRSGLRKTRNSCSTSHLILPHTPKRNALNGYKLSKRVILVRSF